MTWIALHGDRCYCVPVPAVVCVADLRLDERRSQRWVDFDQGTQTLCSRPATRFTHSFYLRCVWEGERCCACLNLVLGDMQCWKHTGQTVKRWRRTRASTSEPEPILEMSHSLYFKAGPPDRNFYINSGLKDNARCERGIHGHELRENYHLTLQFHSAPWSVLLSRSSLFWFYGCQLYCSGSVSPLSSSLVSSRSRQLFFPPIKLPECCLPGTHIKTDQVSN